MASPPSAPTGVWALPRTGSLPKSGLAASSTPASESRPSSNAAAALAAATAAAAAASTSAAAATVASGATNGSAAASAGGMVRTPSTLVQPSPLLTAVAAAWAAPLPAGAEAVAGASNSKSEAAAADDELDLDTNILPSALEDLLTDDEAASPPEPASKTPTLPVTSFGFTVPPSTATPPATDAPGAPGAKTPTLAAQPVASPWSWGSAARAAAAASGGGTVAGGAGGSSAGIVPSSSSDAVWRVDASSPGLWSAAVPASYRSSSVDESIPELSLGEAAIGTPAADALPVGSFTMQRRGRAGAAAGAGAASGPMAASWSAEWEDDDDRHAVPTAGPSSGGSANSSFRDRAVGTPRSWSAAASIGAAGTPGMAAAVAAGTKASGPGAAGARPAERGWMFYDDDQRLPIVGGYTAEDTAELHKRANALSAAYSQLASAIEDEQDAANIEAFYREASFADVARAGVILDDDGDEAALFYQQQASLPLCPYGMSGNCRYAPHCRNLHGLTCPYCHKDVLHPYRPEEHDGAGAGVATWCGWRGPTLILAAPAPSFAAAWFPSPCGEVQARDGHAQRTAARVRHLPGKGAREERRALRPALYGERCMRARASRGPWLIRGPRRVGAPCFACSVRALLLPGLHPQVAGAGRGQLGRGARVPAVPHPHLLCGTLAAVVQERAREGRRHPGLQGEAEVGPTRHSRHDAQHGQT